MCVAKREKEEVKETLLNSVFSESLITYFDPGFHYCIIDLLRNIS